MNSTVNEIDPAVGDEKAEGGDPRRPLCYKDGKGHQDQHCEETCADDGEGLHYEGVRFHIEA